MPYTASRPFDGDLDKAFDLAVAALTALGFRLDERKSDSAQLTGPGMNSNRESPLVGASHLNLSLREGQLHLVAELAAAERLGRFARVFPIALNLVLGLVFLVMFGTIFGGGAPRLFWIGPVVGVTLLNGAVWAVLGPMIARNIRQRTCRGLDTLLTTMVATGQSLAEQTGAVARN